MTTTNGERGRTDPILLVNGTLVGVGGVFTATASVAATAIAALACVVLGVTVVVARR
ncbi:hypothetical protein ACFY36_11230 [Actinoplanes sp. NPDC000266]